jgi:hypothetical protein
MPKYESAKAATKAIKSKANRFGPVYLGELVNERPRGPLCQPASFPVKVHVVFFANVATRKGIDRPEPEWDNE